MTTLTGRKHYHWASSNIARPDPDAPPKSVKNWKPSVQVTTFTSWEQIGAWYASLQKDPVAVTPAIQAKADAVTKGLTSDEDKVRAIFNDVALHIHYVGLEFGIGRYQPHPADDVLSNEYGDCKDKHTLLAALLKAAGIEAWPVLISSGRELDPATPSPAQFDHVITLVPMGGKLLWMDSTEEISPIGVLVSSLRDKQALAVPPGKQAYLERTPADLPFADSVRFQVDGKLSADGVFTGHFDESYHGDTELILRSAFRGVSESQWKELLQGFSNATGFGGEVKNPAVSPIEQTGQPLHFSYDYTREKFGEWDAHRITPPMPPVGWELAPGVKQVKPADDVEIGSPGESIYASTVQLPAGWLLFPVSGTDLKEDWAEYRSTYSFAAGTFTAERRVVVKKDKIPLDQWDKYLAFRRAIYDDEVRMTVVTNPSEPSGAFISSFADTTGLGVRQELIAAVQPIRDIETILEADPPASPEGLSKQYALARTEVDKIDAKSLALPADDAHSLYWAQALAYAWSIRGWAALEVNDLPAAESYLRAAWRLNQDRVSGYLLGRLLEKANNNTAAAHQYELAHVTSASGMLTGFSSSGYNNVDQRIMEAYRKMMGKDLTATSLRQGSFEGSLDQELANQHEFHPLLHTSKLTGSGLFSIAFEQGKPAKVHLLSGDQGFETLVPILQAHVFPPELPNGSKARLLRELRMVCSPYGGCDAYILLPGSIELPGNSFTIPVSSTGTTKTVHVEVQP